MEEKGEAAKGSLPFLEQGLERAAVLPQFSRDAAPLGRGALCRSSDGHLNLG